MKVSADYILPVYSYICNQIFTNKLMIKIHVTVRTLCLLYFSIFFLIGKHSSFSIMDEIIF